MRQSQRAEMNILEVRSIIDNCIMSIIAGNDRPTALYTGSMQARLSITDFEQYVIARAAELLKFK